MRTLTVMKLKCVTSPELQQDALGWWCLRHVLGFGLPIWHLMGSLGKLERKAGKCMFSDSDCQCTDESERLVSRHCPTLEPFGTNMLESVTATQFFGHQRPVSATEILGM